MNTHRHTCKIRQTTDRCIGSYAHGNSHRNKSMHSYQCTNTYIDTHSNRKEKKIKKTAGLDKEAMHFHIKFI